MGWLELLAWLKAMRRQQEGAKASPDSWRVKDPWFAEQHQRSREEERGAV